LELLDIKGAIMSNTQPLKIEEKEIGAFYIPEDIIAHIDPGTYLKFKISAAKGFKSNITYTNLTDSIYEKTGLQVMLLYCRANLCSIIGTPLENINYINCNDGKKRIWGTPLFNVNALSKFCRYIEKDMDIAGMKPIRWTPK
jgi:hypothetical protein